MSGYYGVSKSWLVYQRGKKKDWADWRRESMSGEVLGSIFHDKRDGTFDVTVWTDGKKVVSIKGLKGSLWEMFDKADAAMKSAEGPRTLFNPRVRKYKYHWYPAKGAFWADAGMYYARLKQERGDSRWFWFVATKAGEVKAKVGPFVPMSMSLAKREAEEVLLKLAPPSPRTLFNPVRWERVPGMGANRMWRRSAGSGYLYISIRSDKFPPRHRFVWEVWTGASGAPSGTASSFKEAASMVAAAYKKYLEKGGATLFNSAKHRWEIEMLKESDAKKLRKWWHGHTGHSYRIYRSEKDRRFWRLVRENGDQWEHVHSGVWKRRMAPGHYLHAVESLGKNIWYWWVQVGKQVGIRKSSASFAEAKEQALKAYRSLKLEPMLFNARRNADPRFEALASAQRDKPEGAMLRLSHAQISQLYGTTTEHVGDLTHRMSQQIDFFKGGYEWVEEKVRKTLRWLTNPYGFEREVLEQIERNTDYYRERGSLPSWWVSKETALRRLKRLGRLYAAEHRKLPVFNAVQRVARDAAIAVGEWRFKDAVDRLRSLKYLLEQGPEVWAREAMKTKNNPNVVWRKTSSVTWSAIPKKGIELMVVSEGDPVVKRHHYGILKGTKVIFRASTRHGVKAAQVGAENAYAKRWAVSLRSKKTFKVKENSGARRRSRVKTYFVARFRPPHPQKGEFWTASEVIDTLPATVVGGVYKISASNRVQALAQAKAAHAKGR